MTNKHPSALGIFFATEMWERYGFYTVQTLLTLFLVLAFKWNDEAVYPLVGSFTALTYLSPVIGGWIADHFLGQKRSVILGALVLFISYILLSMTRTDEQLMISLAGIAVGTGLLKPNISSLLGTQYPPDSPNRERGFTIFYMGITTGIILGTTLPSALISLFGWHASFGSAAIGLVIAMAVFFYGIFHYDIEDFNPYQHNWRKILAAAALIILMGVGAFYILHTPAVADSLFTIIGLVSLGYLLYTIYREDTEQAKKTMVIGLLCAISVVFWAFYFQMFLSITLLLKRIVAPGFLGINFPPPFYVAVQSIGMIVIGFFLGRKNRKIIDVPAYSIRTAKKFFYAVLLITTAYAMIALTCASSTSDKPFYPLFFIPPFLVISLAELLLSPVGLSAITLLSDHKKVSTMTGIFFVSLGIGGYIAGKMAKLTAVGFDWPNALSTGHLKMHYAATFGKIVYIAAGMSLVCYGIYHLIKYIMRK